MPRAALRDDRGWHRRREHLEVVWTQWSLLKPTLPFEPERIRPSSRCRPPIYGVRRITRGCSAPFRRNRRDIRKSETSKNFRKSEDDLGGQMLARVCGSGSPEAVVRGAARVSFAVGEAPGSRILPGFQAHSRTRCRGPALAFPTTSTTRTCRITARVALLVHSKRTRHASGTARATNSSAGTGRSPPRSSRASVLTASAGGSPS